MEGPPGVEQRLRFRDALRGGPYDTFGLPVDAGRTMGERPPEPITGPGITSPPLFVPIPVTLA